MGGDPNRPIVRNHSYGDTKTPDSKTLATDFVFKTPGGYKFTIDEVTKVFQMETPGGRKITLDDTASKTILDEATAIELVKGATEALVMGTTFKIAFDAFILKYNTHTQIGNLGAPTGPPVIQATETVQLSTKVKTG